MPGFDRTGPEGQGSQTGRGLGKCNPNKKNDDAVVTDGLSKALGLRRGRGTGKGFRFGRGKGYGRGLGKGNQ